MANEEMTRTEALEVAIAVLFERRAATIRLMTQFAETLPINPEHTRVLDSLGKSYGAETVRVTRAIKILDELKREQAGWLRYHAPEKQWPGKEPTHD